MARPKEKTHKTAEHILQSAKSHFLQKGFEGTSINDIADEASIHKSLIYHHFRNKEGLWKAVKENILQQATPLELNEISFSRKTLEDFLRDFISFRFNLYAQHPEIIRLMHWQRLEVNHSSLEGIRKNQLVDLEEDIVALQTAGEIRSDLDPQMVMYLIRSTASNGFMDKESFLENKTDQEKYLGFILDGLYRALSPK